MNAKTVLTGFLVALVLIGLGMLAMNGFWKEAAIADGTGKSQSYKYRTPLDVSKKGLRKLLEEGVERAVVLPRYFCTRAMGETGDPYFTPRLIALLNTEDDNGVKGVVLEAMAKIGGKEAGQVILRVLTSGSGHVKSEAASAIGYLKNEVAIQGLTEALKGKNTFVRVRATYGISHYGGEDVRSHIALALKDPQFKVRESMVQRIPELSPGLRLYTVRLALKDERHEVRKIALEKFYETDINMPPQEIIQYLQDKSTAVKTACAKLCGKLKLTDAVPALLRLADPKGSENLLSAVGTALGKIGDPRAVEALQVLAGVEAFIPRGDALLAFGRLGYRPALDLLREGLNHAKPYVRHRAALALHMMGEPGMLDLFNGSLDSEDLVTRANSVYTLGEEPQKEFIPIFSRAALNDKDPKVREVAVKGLAMLLEYPEAVACLGKTIKDEARDVRFWVLKSISDNPRSEVIPMIREATKDEAWDIRRIAYRYLIKHDLQGSLSQLKVGGKDIDWRVKAEIWGALYKHLCS